MIFGFKKRSRYGQFLDDHGIKQEKVREVTKISRDTLWRACNDEEYKPTASTRELLIAALKRLTGKNIDKRDFWA